MAKTKDTLFICKNCGNEFTKWQGQCSYCQEWNTLKEITNSQLVSPKGARKKSSSPSSNQRDQVKPMAISQIQSQHVNRFTTGFSELDEVYGGGIVPGSVSLLSGEPGMGKSTLLTQLALNLTTKQILNQIQDDEHKKKSNVKGQMLNVTPKGVLYICGEESPEQVKLRIDRLSRILEPDASHPQPTTLHSELDSESNTDSTQNDNIALLSEISVEAIIDHLLKHSGQYQLVIIDSIQSLVSDQLTSFAGSVGQVRECGFQLTQALKQTRTAGIIVGHVTKDGSLAGPKTLEHMVDAVFRLEGDRTHDLRLVRSVKNRFGTTDEVGIFRMTGQGLVEVINPGDIFLENSQQGQPGSVTTAVLEGNRVMLLEIQALVIKSNLAMPRRVANGVKIRRLQMILAVLQKQLNLHLGEMDVFINVAGGINIDEPAADLAMAVAIISSLKNKAVGIGVGAPLVGAQSRAGTRPAPTKPNTPSTPIVFGEMGLLGEIRPVAGQDKRIQQAKKLGYTHFIGVEEQHIREVKI